jgi:hypothetical protein
MSYRQFNPSNFQQLISLILYIKLNLQFSLSNLTVNSIRLFFNYRYRQFNLSNLTVNSICLSSNNRYRHFNLSYLTVNSIRLFSKDRYRQFNLSTSISHKGTIPNKIPPSQSVYFPTTDNVNSIY